MIIENYINNIPNSTTNILHNSIEYALTKLLYNPYSQNEFDNTILNPNLSNHSIIK